MNARELGWFSSFPRDPPLDSPPTARLPALFACLYLPPYKPLPTSPPRWPPTSTAACLPPAPTYLAAQPPFLLACPSCLAAHPPVLLAALLPPFRYLAVAEFNGVAPRSGKPLLRN